MDTREVLLPQAYAAPAGDGFLGGGIGSLLIGAMLFGNRGIAKYVIILIGMIYPLFFKVRQ